MIIGKEIKTRTIDSQPDGWRTHTNTQIQEAGRGATQTNMTTPAKPFQRVRHWSLLHTLGTATGGGKGKYCTLSQTFLGGKRVGVYPKDKTIRCICAQLK